MGTDLKASLETPAGPLSGTEFWRAVQDGVNVRISASQVAVLAAGLSIVSVPYAASITFDLTDYADILEVMLELDELTGNVTFDLINGFDGQKITVIVPQDATGGRIWTSGSHLAMSADITSIVLSTTASKTDYLGFRWHAGSGKARILAVNKGF